MSIWDNFYRLSVLKVEFLESSTAKNAVIYGNGLNQVAVIVHVTILDKDNNKLSITNDELKAQTSLINYQTGEKLVDSPWVYSDSNYGYDEPVSYSSATYDQQLYSADDSTYLVYYVSASDLSAGVDIGASINVPGVGEFNTTADGTSTHNAPGGTGGSVFKSPSFVHVQALNSIDYSQNKNLTVENAPTGFGSFATNVSDVLVRHNNWAGVDYDNNEGISGKTTTTITPANENLKFKSINVTSDNATSGFNVADGKCDTVWGVGGENYDTIFIFVNKEHYGLLPGNTIHVKGGSEDYYYIIGTGDGRFHWTESLVDGAITIRICNHRIPRDDVHQNGWYDSGKNIKVDVIDNFGNSGTVTIRVDDSSWPQLHINS